MSDSEALATSVPDNGGVYFVPAFSGLYAPYWRNDARGLVVGLTAFNTRAHLVRAALEASAFQAREVIEAMERDFGLAIPRLNVDGGMTANNFLMQVLLSMLVMPNCCAITSSKYYSFNLTFWASLSCDPRSARPRPWARRWRRVWARGSGREACSSSVASGLRTSSGIPIWTKKSEIRWYNFILWYDCFAQAFMNSFTRTI